MLRRAKSGELGDERFRLGNYAFRRPDYNQILAWGRALEMDPQRFVAVLEDIVAGLDDFDRLLNEWSLEVEEGRILSLVWDFNCLPFVPDIWQPSLHIRNISFVGQAPDILLRLRGNQSCLQTLQCFNCGFSDLDLLGACNLRGLYCWSNKLRNIDTRSLACLERLKCDGNQIEDIKLNNARMTFLRCGDNALESLDLTMTRSLTTLSCNGNRLSMLDLSAATQLESLDCSRNKISELDLSSNVKLRKITCDIDVKFAGCPPGLEVKRVR